MYRSISSSRAAASPRWWRRMRRWSSRWRRARSEGGRPPAAGRSATTLLAIVRYSLPRPGAAPGHPGVRFRTPGPRAAPVDVPRRSLRAPSRRACCSRSARRSRCTWTARSTGGRGADREAGAGAAAVHATGNSVGRRCAGRALPALTGETRARGPKSRSAAGPRLSMWAASQRAARRCRTTCMASAGLAPSRPIAHLTVTTAVDSRVRGRDRAEHPADRAALRGRP